LDPSPSRMLDGKVCLITGASSGLGKETSIALAEMGARVVMVCRNRERGEVARKEIVEKSGNPSIDLIVCDLSSLAEVRKLADEVLAKYSVLNVLINNAGVVSIGGGTTVDGFETTLAVNYLAPFLLTNLLLELLKNSAPSRIVNVSSDAHIRGRLDLDQIAKGKSGARMSAYANSKLALVMFTYELARRLQGTGVTANCLHPGDVATKMWRMPSFLTRLFLKSVSEGAQTIIFLASSPKVEGLTGRYFEDEKEKRSSDESYDEEEGRRLWDVTCRLVGLPIAHTGS